MWLALLIPLVPYLARRVLLGLGIGILTYAGSEALISFFTAQVSAHLSASAGVVLQMASLFGFTDAASILLGALSTAASVSAFKKFALL